MISKSIFRPIYLHFNQKNRLSVEDTAILSGFGMLLNGKFLEWISHLYRGKFSPNALNWMWLKKGGRDWNGSSRSSLGILSSKPDQRLLFPVVITFMPINRFSVHFFKIVTGPKTRTTIKAFLMSPHSPKFTIHCLRILPLIHLKLFTNKIAANSRSIYRQIWIVCPDASNSSQLEPIRAYLSWMMSNIVWYEFE